MSDKLKTPESWDKDYTKLWTDYQKAQERICKYRKQIDSLNKIKEAAEAHINFDIDLYFRDKARGFLNERHPNTVALLEALAEHKTNNG